MRPGLTSPEAPGGQPGHLLAPLARLAAGPGVGRGATRAAGPARVRRSNRLGASPPGQRQCACKKGDGTGRNPTDSGKPGVKPHVLSGSNGVPLVARVGPANRHDSKDLQALLDAVAPIRRPSGQCCERRARQHADDEFDNQRCRWDCRRFEPRIAWVGVEPRERPSRPRWVVERTLARFKRFRRLAVRYERRDDLHQASLPRRLPRHHRQGKHVRTRPEYRLAL